MGITRTVLLPAGSKYGLAVGAGGNDSCRALAQEVPEQFVFFTNELPDLPEARQALEKYLNAGAIGIGEQKFNVQCDSPFIHLVADVAQEFGVPVLMHFQHDVYNMGIERFHTVLEKHPKASIIGHAQTWWGNIDRNHDQNILYPKTKVTPGGITDRLLSDYPNMYGDLSAGAGLNSMLRDEDQAREFLKRHQDKRSEEHTSELQSQSNLVCRLLLEKKKTSPRDSSITPPVSFSSRSRASAKISLLSAPSPCHSWKRYPPAASVCDAPPADRAEGTYA